MRLERLQARTDVGELLAVQFRDPASGVGLDQRSNAALSQPQHQRLDRGFRRPPREVTRIDLRIGALQAHAVGEQAAQELSVRIARLASLALVGLAARAAKMARVPAAVAISSAAGLRLL